MILFKSHSAYFTRLILTCYRLAQHNVQLLRYLSPDWPSCQCKPASSWSSRA